MKLFVGLGNPGTKYAHNRHNIGFMAVDRIADDHGFSPWRARFQGLASEGALGDEKVVLLKPATFMNLSGQSVGEAMRFFKLSPADVMVFHDELDLAPGKIRVKQGGGHAGHNGLRSMHAHITEGYARVRLGIGHPGHKDAVSGFVLSNFSKADTEWMDDLMYGISDGATDLARGDTARFLNKIGLRMTPTRPEKSAKGPKQKARPTAAPRSASPQVTAEPSPKVQPVGPETPVNTAPPKMPDTRSALQRLADKFR
ncbi:MAG: PTH1 family peptidyl-tRNA hydrolase [Paracoccaceae bacterium]